MAITRASGVARYLAATAVTAPVLISVIHVASMTARGAPVSAPVSTSNAVVTGTPVPLFDGKTLTILAPAADWAGTWATSACVNDSGRG